MGSSEAERLGEEESDCIESERCRFLEPVWGSLTASLAVVGESDKDIGERGEGKKPQITRLETACPTDPVLQGLRGR